MPASTCLVVLNPKAGGAKPEAIRSTVIAALAAAGREARFVELTPETDLCEAVDREVKAATQGGCDMVVAAGGDGTLSLVADSLARTGAHNGKLALGILPAGTMNVLARELGIPGELDQAASLLGDGAPRIEVDAMRFSGRLYFVQIGIGLDAAVIDETSPAARHRFGQLAYFVPFLRKLFGTHANTFTFTIDGRRRRHRALQVVVANARTLGMPPFTWGPRIDPTDGVLNLCLFDVHSVWDWTRVLWRLLSGHHRGDPATRFYTFREKLVVRSRRPLRVQADGEVAGETPVEIEIVPKALKVVVSEEFLAAKRAAEPGEVPDAPRPKAWRTAWRLVARRMAPLGALDTGAFLKLNAMRRAELLDRFMWAVSRWMQYGDAWVALALLGAFAKGRAGIRMFLDVVPPLWLAMLTVNYPIKAFFRRKRPFHPYEHVRVIGRRPLDPSFPSGHTAGAFAGAFLLSTYYPALAPLFYGFAALIAFSRVYLGVHYPSDVLVGGLAGALLAAGVRLLLRLLVRVIYPASP